MNEDEKSLRTLFGEATEITDPAERVAYLDRVCGPNLELRRRLEDLLRANDAAGGFLGESKATTEADSLSEASPTRIGRYRLLERIGEGGCGVVFLAEQEKPLRRRVALKVIKLGMDTKAVIARFELERQALALMDHPSIAKVLDAGTTGVEGSEISNPNPLITSGRPYFVMELVQGPRITDYCDQNQLSTRERLMLFMGVCRAIQHAHQKGIIHRDLKPSNILVTSQDGEPLPKVIDFGIAKATGDVQLTDQTLFTATDQFIGTPAYMSPEQAGLAALDIDTRSDVYSLGVLLYELLTGRTPFEPRDLLKAGFDEMRRIIRETDPARPSTRVGTMVAEDLATVARRRACDPPYLLHLLRGDLDWVVMKCLEKDRSRRYETANGLAADLQRHLDNEPVVARPPSGGYRLQKLIRRHKMAFAAAGTVATAMLSGTAISLLQVAQTNEAKADLRSHLYAADMGLAFASWEAGNVPRARDLLNQQRISDQADLRGFEWRLLYSLTRSQELFGFEAGESIYGSAVSPDGKYFAAGLAGATVRLWELTTRQEVASISPGGFITYSLAFSPDSQLLAGCTFTAESQFVYLWDLPKFELVGKLEGHTNAVLSLAFSRDGQTIASSAGMPYNREFSGGLILWDVPSRRKLADLEGHGNTSTCFLAFSPTDDLLATPHGNGTINIWDVPSRRILHTLRGHRDLVLCVKFSPDGRLLASGGIDGTIRLWNLETGQLHSNMGTHGHDIPFYSVAFSPDGSVLASGGQDHTTRLWEIHNGKEVAILRGHSDRVFSVNFTPDGTRIVSASLDGTARVYSVQALSSSNVFDRHEELDSAKVAFSPNGEWLTRLTSRPVPRITIWRSATRTKVVTVDAVECGFSFNGKYCVTMPGTNGFDVWDASGESIRLVKQVSHEAQLDSKPVFSPDNQWLALSADVHGTNILAVWHADADAFEEVARLADASPERRRITYYHFSPDSKTLAVSQDDGSTRLWNVGRWKRGRLIEHPGSIWPVVFSPDWQWMAIGKGTKVLLIALNNHRTAELRGEAGGVTTLAFAPDGRTLAVGSHQGLIKFWQVHTQREISRFRAHVTLVDSLAFSPDGTILATTSFDQSMKLWIAPNFAECDAKTASDFLQAQ